MNNAPPQPSAPSVRWALCRRAWEPVSKLAGIALLPLSVAAALAGAAETPLPVERFANPPAESRILKIIHSWPDKPDAQDALIGRLKQQGFGGVVCNVSFKDYLESDAGWQAFVRAVKEAKNAGLAMWLYDERGYPSGNAGGLVLRDHPDWEAQGLLIANTECAAGPVNLDVPPGQLFFAAAFPVTNGMIDLGAKVDLTTNISEAKLSWNAPQGRWQVMAITQNRLYDGTHAEMNLARKMPYIDLLRPEPTARFIELTHQRYAQKLGDDLGRYFIATFTDEPSLMSCLIRAMPYRVLPWAANLPTEFKRRRGRDLAPLVPALIADAGPPGQQARYDYWLTVGELVADNFFGQIQNWCASHKVLSGGHLLMEEGLVAHVPLYGDFFRCARRLDAPGIDCLTSVPPEVPWFIARLLGSVAELEGRRVVMSETSDHAQRYRPPGDQRPARAVTEAEIRGTCNRLMVAGVNAITSYYSFADLSDDQLRRLNEYVGRCCALLTGGHRVADIAVVYPVESVWVRFQPSRHWTKEAAEAGRVENVFRSVTESLFAAQRDFTFVDSRALAEAEVVSGRLEHGNLRWRVVVLPMVDTLPLRAWNNLARFVSAGGVVIAVGALPANSERDFPSPRSLYLGKQMFGNPKLGPHVFPHLSGGAGIYLPPGSEGVLPLALRGVLDPDVAVADPTAPLRVTHRRLNRREVYFLINDSPQPWQGPVTFAAAGESRRWNPADGAVFPDAGTNTLSLKLEPYGSAFVEFAAPRPPRRHRIEGGVLPNLAVRALPQVEPRVVGGEFVHTQSNPQSATNAAPGPAWRTTGVLTKGQVDTFLFVLFHHPRPFDLTGADCVVIDTWVPEAQRTPNQIVVILHEDGGGDFLAETGRSLSAPGYERTCIPLSRFQLAGWSKDSDGLLDLKKVSDVRIGWGGYLGQEGETVEFTVARPQIGSVAGSRSVRSANR